MRASFLAVATSAVVVLVSFAGTRTRPSLHPDTLARYEAITSYCEKLDATSASQYAARLDELTRGHSSQEILTRRASSAYREAMAQANDVLSTASTSTAVNGCTEFLAEK